MIVILYNSGNFGSTLEYCLHTYSTELEKVDWGLLDNGSMHGFIKESHLPRFKDFDLLDRHSTKIITPVYPTLDYKNPSETLRIWQDKFTSHDRVVLVYGATLDQIERTQLFLFHKQHQYLDNVMRNKAQSWNLKYQQWQDMARYELREALSFLIDQQVEYLGIEQQVPDTWYKITPNDILWNFKSQVLNLLNHCKLTYNQNSIDEFYQLWISKQKYILDEFDCVLDIVDSVVSARYLEWNNLSIVGEAIIQSRLRRQGIDLACYNLNNFPTNSSDLNKYLCVLK
jgi:hypothetical protein